MSFRRNSDLKNDFSQKVRIIEQSYRVHLSLKKFAENSDLVIILIQDVGSWDISIHFSILPCGPFNDNLISTTTLAHKSLGHPIIY